MHAAPADAASGYNRTENYQATKADALPGQFHLVMLSLNGALASPTKDQEVVIDLTTACTEITPSPSQVSPGEILLICCRNVLETSLTNFQFSKTPISQILSLLHVDWLDQGPVFVGYHN
ncbi:hypothetical protein ACE6H2_008069 [Prunus campanulata]